MSKKMLIDAAHDEEVRVCVMENRKVEDFDFESSARKPLRGNIYLARVTRVEPSLQAAFVEYGGNRHGFLAFNEIHPDYYQIPVSDREQLQAAEAEEAALAAQLDLVHRGDEDEDDEIGDDFSDNEEVSSEQDGDQDNGDEGDGDQEGAVALDAADPADSPADNNSSDNDAGDDAGEETGNIEASDDAPVDDDAAETDADQDGDEKSASAIPFVSNGFPFLTKSTDALDPPVSDDTDPSDDEEIDAPIDVEATDTGDEDDADQDDVTEADEASTKDTDKRAKRRELLEKYNEARRKRARLIRNYKIQEVIKRRQILLIQVVKEERGNKGAAVTSYMSLAGRYCVLMPNTARGGGISRKIPNASDRKRLRRIVDTLDVSEGMGLIIRTAGAKRTKTEIKRDYDYLIRLWENIRSLTLESIAPCLIYEEASLIKRAIRDLYDKDISRVLVEGENGYREAKDFMKMLMPSHAKNVQPYKEKLPLFVRHDVEKQLDAMYQPTARLKSGGYLVINQTEALIAVDVNSGKATRERNIELTALKTNLEAAVETARQCRLRDLAGLIVIDFIDMEENKNNRAVEKKLKEALKNDRARIQVGRISSFGLLEMSRQRRRSGIVDGTTHACPTCSGAGAVRSNEMAALRILRAVESDAIAGRAATISVKASTDVSLYVLNQKRDWLNRLETQYALTIEIDADPTKFGDQYEIEKRGAPRPHTEKQSIVRADSIDTAVSDEEADTAETTEQASDDDKPTKKRRRRRRKKRSDDDTQDLDAAPKGDDAGTQENDEEKSASDDETEGGEQKKRRRRGRRGGRRRNKRTEGDEGQSTSPENGASDEAANVRANSDEPTAETAGNGAPNESGRDEPASATNGQNGSAPETSDASNTMPTPVKAEKTTDTGGIDPASAPQTTPVSEDSPDSPEEIAERVKKRKSSKKGWWSRAIGG